MKDLEILKRMILEADEETVTVDSETTQVKEKPKNVAFEKDPMGFILKKYSTLNEIMTELMTKDFREFVDAIFYIAPKPTTFKIQLHNGQSFFMMYMKENIYEAIISGKRYYLAGIGEKERCMMAIARLLRFGTPLKTKGAEGAEEGTRDSENTGMEGDWAANGGAGGEAAPEAGGGEVDTTAGEGGEELTENKRILEAILKNREIIQKNQFLKEEDETSAGEYEDIAVDLWNASLKSKKVPKEYSQYKALFNSIFEITKKLKSPQSLEKFSGQRLPTSEFWVKNSGGKIQDEPKTDIISQNLNRKISVKKGKSQLMSAEKKEAIATFMAVAQKIGLSEKAQSEVVTILNDFAATTRTKGLNTGELSKATESNLDKINKEAKNIYNEAQKSHKEIQSYLKNLVETNEQFEREFIYEAASGYIKFDDNNGTANYILAISDSGDAAKLKPMINSSSTAITNMMGKIKVSATMKSGSYKVKGQKAGYAFYSSLRIGLDDVLKKTETLKESYIKDKSIGLLTESKQLMYENIIQKIWNWIKNAYKWIQDTITKAIEAVSSGFQQTLEVVEMVPDVNPEIYSGAEYDWM
tara:strand:- start:2902 stop:4653 length:1752 start_codon:yes stop_codon:yes gene_type:complete